MSEGFGMERVTPGLEEVEDRALEAFEEATAWAESAGPDDERAARALARAEAWLREVQGTTKPPPPEGRGLVS